MTSLSTKNDSGTALQESAKYKVIQATCISCIVGAFLTGIVMSSDASLEVLSDMDCVIEPSAVVELGSAVPGLIAESYFDRTDFVTKGAIIAQLESSVERVTLAIAEEVASSSTAVDLRQVSAKFGHRTRARNEILLKTSGVSRQLMDQVEVERARASLNRREIRSPFSGTITEVYKAAGEYIDSDAIYQLAKLDPLNVEVIVPIDYLGMVETGMSAQISLDVPGFENNILEAMVRRIDSVADAASATYGVRLTLENPELTIPSGVRCQVDFFAS